MILQNRKELLQVSGTKSYDGRLFSVLSGNDAGLSCRIWGEDPFQVHRPQPLVQTSTATVTLPSLRLEGEFKANAEIS